MMSKKKLSILFPFFAILLVACSANNTKSPSASSASQTRKVIIVVVDGPRYSETWGDPSHQYIPHMANEMVKEGAVFTNFLNDGYTYTNSGHAALTTGHRQQINNTGKEFPKYPSLFQYYLKKTGKENTSAWIITSKDKLEILGNTNDTEWKGKFQPATNCGNAGLGTGYRDDQSTYTKSIEILQKHHPDLVLINFKEPDGSGHANDWNGYLKGIRDTDVHVWNLWKFIKSDSIYKNQTAFFVTNDHGRHLDGIKDGFVNHGCSCEGCRHINLYAYGPDFKKEMIDDTYALQDITATIAYFLKLDMPYSQGKVIDSLLLNKKD